MRISDLFIMGLRNLSRRKARTILTVLGVVIGSLFIIIMLAIGKGMNNNFQTQLMQQGGMTTITVNNMGYSMDAEGNYSEGQAQKLDDNLVNRLKQLEHVKAVTPVINVDAALWSGRYTSFSNITAVDLEIFEAFDFPELQYGKYPSVEDRTPIVFGFYCPWGFFDPNSRSRFGNDIQIDLQKQKVVLKFQRYPVDPKKKGKEFSLPLKNISKMTETRGEYDGNTYMDIKYFKEIYHQYCNTLTLEDRKKALRDIEAYQQIKLNADNVNNVTEIQDEIKKLGFQSNSQMEWIKPMQKQSQTLQMVLGCMGGVTMFVSAISIANTMVMSIYERTKEIGIMKVLGCVVTDIRKLFLFEAAIIGLFGGIIGIILSYLSSWLLNKFGSSIFSALMSGNYMYDMTNATFCIIPIYLPFAALALSICVGLVSGYFPARRATKISAIEAMKTEG